MSVNIMVAFDEEIFPLTLTASSKIKEIISILQSLVGVRNLLINNLKKSKLKSNSLDQGE